MFVLQDNDPAHKTYVAMQTVRDLGSNHSNPHDLDLLTSFLNFLTIANVLKTSSTRYSVALLELLNFVKSFIKRICTPHMNNTFEPLNQWLLLLYRSGSNNLFIRKIKNVYTLKSSTALEALKQNILLILKFDFVSLLLFTKNL